MKKLFWIIIIAAVLGGGFYVLQSKISAEPPVVADPLSTYFQERMSTLGVENLGAHPIEGFDAELLLGAFPSLEPSDFRGVETFEGYYEVVDGTVNFIRTAGDMITSAEKTVSEKGFDTLLHNVSLRIAHSITDNSSVDALIERISKTKSTSGKLNEEIIISGLIITLTQVVEDSRCPRDVQCIQAGTVRVRGTLGDGSRTTSQIFKLGESVTLGEKKVKLTKVEPDTISNTKIENSSYIFHFSEEKTP